MLIIQRPSVEALGEEEANRQRFAIGPLEPGFGYTLGVALRRTLLSSIPGAAITEVRFDEALHEFTTIPGVKEDVTEIILNLKDVVLDVQGDDAVTLRLDVTGPATVTAGDIPLSSDVEICNPELVIANVAAQGRLAFEVTVERGTGYVSAERNKHSAVIGVIPIDSIFSPVRRVAYNVEQARVGQRTDFDKLTLDIETDGSIDPHAALREAAEILISQLAIFTDAERVIELRDSHTSGILDTGLAGIDALHGAAGRAPSAMDDILIEELELGVRSYNCLKRAGIQTVGDLVSRSEGELNAIPNFGKKSIDEVIETLQARGLTLRDG